MGHGHHHHDHHHPGHGGRLTLDGRLWASVAINAAITLAEFIAGIVTGSLALMADAVHNLSDVAALLLTIGARYLGRRPPSVRHTYGLRRVEILAALINALALLGLAVFIGREAVERLMQPRAIASGPVLIVAAVALLGNSVGFLLLRRPGDQDINVRSAAMHLLQDALASVVVILAALFMSSPVGPYLDPIASLIVGFSVIWSAVSIAWESLHLLVEGTPFGLDVAQLALGVDENFAPARIHHVHVWELGPGQRALTAHLSVPDMPLTEAEILMGEIRHFLHDEYQIEHATLEPEVSGCGESGLLGQPRCR